VKIVPQAGTVTTSAAVCTVTKAMLEAIERNGTSVMMKMLRSTSEAEVKAQVTAEAIVVASVVAEVAVIAEAAVQAAVGVAVQAKVQTEVEVTAVVEVEAEVVAQILVILTREMTTYLVVTIATEFT
jgi:hypothetical protein